jgi:hypothetical protein
MLGLVEPDLFRAMERDTHDTVSPEDLAARLGAHRVDCVDHRGGLPRVSRLTRC